MIAEFNPERVFSEVVLGRTQVSIVGRRAFLKHLTPIQKGQLHAYYDAAVDKARKNGVVSTVERLESLKENGSWADDKETAYLNAQSFVYRLQDAFKTLAFKSQKDAQLKEIGAAQQTLWGLQSERNLLIGLTTELYADRQLNEKFIFNSLYKDEDCHTLFFSPDEYEELDDKEISEIIKSVNEVTEEYAKSWIKKTALSSLVQDMIRMCADTVMDFYGVSVSRLSYYQTELLYFGKYFKQIFSDPKTQPPAHLRDDPAKLLDWYHSKTNADNIIGTAENAFVFGATQDDLKDITGEKDVTSIQSILKDSGTKNLRGDALAKILGGA